MPESVFSKNLMKYRRLRGMTQEALAGRLSVTPQAVSKWEKGGYPDSELLPEISRVLDISLDVLFGLKSEESVSPAALLAEALQELPEAEKPDFCMNLFFTILSAYSNIKACELKIPKKLLRETYSELKTDHEYALARLNPDMRYFCFVQLPKEGINSYAKIDDRMLQFFRMLSDRDTLRIIYFFAAVERNHLWSAASIAEKLRLPLQAAEKTLDELDRSGVIWKIMVDEGSEKGSVYGYTYSTPLTTILILATSFINYLQYTDPLIEKWTKGAFSAEDANES